MLARAAAPLFLLGAGGLATGAHCEQPVTTKNTTGLPFLEALDRLPKRVQYIGHTTPKEHRENEHSGNGGTLYTRGNLYGAASSWAKRSKSMQAPRWASKRLADGRYAIVDLQAKPGAPVEFEEPRKGQAFAADATR